MKRTASKDRRISLCGPCKTLCRSGAYPFRNRINSWRPAHIHFFGIRNRLCATIDNPDVFRGGSAHPPRFHHRNHPRQIGGRSFDGKTRPQCIAPAGVPRLPLRYCVAGTPPDLVRKQASGKLHDTAPFLPIYRRRHHKRPVHLLIAVDDIAGDRGVDQAGIDGVHTDSLPDVFKCSRPRRDRAWRRCRSQ